MMMWNKFPSSLNAASKANLIAIRSLKTATTSKSSVASSSSKFVRKTIPSSTIAPKSTVNSTYKPVSSSNISSRYATTTTRTRATTTKAKPVPTTSTATASRSSSPTASTSTSTPSSSSSIPPSIDPSIFAATIPSSTTIPKSTATPSTSSTSTTSSQSTQSTQIPITAPTITSPLEFNDSPLDEGVENGENWTKSFRGLGSEPFSQQVTDTLLADLKPSEVEITPDGLLFLPEIRYRRVLNRAFGPGGWGLAPRSKTLVTAKSVSREYALICHGRLVALARGEQDYFDPNGITTAMEGCKSNAMMRCCKDLGIASELWDPVYIRDFKNKYCEQKYFEKKRRMVWKRKDREWEYPYK